LCFHGFLGVPEAFAEVARVSLHRGPIVGVRLPGHGSVPWGLELDGFDDAVREIAQLLPVEGAHLLGYSMGGRVALGLAEATAERVLSVTAVGAHPGIADLRAREARHEVDLGWATQLRSAGLTSFVDAWEKLPLFASQALLSADALAAQRTSRLAHTPEGLARALEILGTGAMRPLGARLSEARVPVRFAVGALDRDYVAHARSMSRRSPFVEAWIVSGVGHNLTLEAPSELARIVDSLTSGVESRPRRGNAP